jgi:4-hydroxybenzoate polyprenyltransferase
MALVRSLRPRQWTKNLLLYLALGFSIHRAWEPTDLPQLGRLLVTATIGFVLFCALSGAVYLLNDILDADKDRAHPTKRRQIGRAHV